MCPYVSLWVLENKLVIKAVSEQQLTAVSRRDQPCSLGYGAGRVRTQALCRGPSVKKTPIQINPEDHLLGQHTLVLVRAHVSSAVLQQEQQLTLSATAGSQVSP